MNPTKRWKRVLAIGCSHGHFIDTKAAENVLRFRWGAFKPDVVVHLGDAVDLASLRSGARHDPEDTDNTFSLEDDIGDGLAFLKELQPTHFCYGNHEDRLNWMANHWHARHHTLGRALKRQLHEGLGKAQIMENWDQSAWFKFGDTLFGHGIFFGRSFLQQSADSFGKCVVAHAHHPGSAQGQRIDHPTALSVGCLRTIKSATYAKDRRATLAWGHGFVWGEFCDTTAQLWLHSVPDDCKEWRLPA